MATALEVPVLWKDVTGTGIEGTEVVAADELPQCGWEGATVNDLIRLLDDKFENSAAASRASYVRQVKSLLLYGTHLSHGRLLSSVIVSLSACCPRLVATTRLVRAKSQINIFVQPPNGRLLCLVCALDETIDEVKRRIEGRTGYPPAQQRLILSGKHLYGSRTLAEYSVYSECTLYLVNRLCGGYTNNSAKKFADVTDDSLVGVYEFSTHAPAWRKVGRGLNLEGQCGTPSCAAFRHWIIHQHGLNSFNLYRDGCIHCPMCASEVTPLTCLFYDCVWKYEGARAGDGVHLSSGWKSAIEDGKYHRFDVDEIRGIVAWEGLLIIVQSSNVAQAAMLVAGNAGELTPRPDKMCCVCWSPAASMKRWSRATSMKKNFAPITCGHSVHSACIAEWGSWCKRGRVPFSCPVCRKDLSNEALTPHLA